MKKTVITLLLVLSLFCTLPFTALGGSEPMLYVVDEADLLNDDEEYKLYSRVSNIFGDGHASERITDILQKLL